MSTLVYITFICLSRLTDFPNFNVHLLVPFMSIYINKKNIIGTFTCEKINIID